MFQFINRKNNINTKWKKERKEEDLTEVNL